MSDRCASRRNSAFATMISTPEEDPPAPRETARHLPPALERIVAHCLEKNSEERFQSARDIAFDLEQLSSASASTTALSGRSTRRWLPWVLGALVVAALMAASYRAGGGGAAEKPI